MDVRLETMTLDEKLQMMEILWDDLCKQATDLVSPSWHEAVLQNRAAAVARGEEISMDWEIAKRDIRNLIK